LASLAFKSKKEKKDGLEAFENGFIAQGGGDVGFAHAGRSDDDQVGRFFEPLGGKELQDFLLGIFGLKAQSKSLRSLIR